MQAVVHALLILVTNVWRIVFGLELFNEAHTIWNSKGEDMNKYNITILIGSLSLFSCQQKSADTAGDSAAVTPEECFELSIDSCESVENCAVLGGIPITASEDEACYYEGEAQAYGCIDMSDPCPPTIAYAYEPDTSNLIMFTYGCLPNGWEDVDLLSYEVCQ